MGLLNSGVGNGKRFLKIPSLGRTDFVEQTFPIVSVFVDMIKDACNFCWAEV